ncbi:MAG: hypothetical protein M5U19_02255 [Microthrixaceae bacterium]|nr:hypothetical protein [Microthrixaceae bacterium]
MDLPVMPPVKPMLAKASRELPEGDFLYEPKWDGFRALVFRDGDEMEITSRNTKPLTRYFPELLEPLRAQLPRRCVIDGELVIPDADGLDFDLLGQRIHPAASRIEHLAAEIPAHLVIFDILALEDLDLRPIALADRRATLESVLEDRPTAAPDPGHHRRVTCHRVVRSLRRRRLRRGDGQARGRHIRGGPPDPGQGEAPSQRRLRGGRLRGAPQRWSRLPEARPLRDRRG